MKKISYCAAILAAAICAPASSMSASRELLLFQEIPTVYTSSKKEQVVIDSPSAVSIITDEDIRAYGVRNIPDLLRNAAGVDVLSISATDANVSIRGFNKDTSHKLLVLIDGRTVYLDFMGIVLWESLPVNIDEIKRIEVVKGPDSAVWGGNAYSGIINIVTKRPEEMEGARASISYGEYDTRTGSASLAGRLDGSAYKLSVGWKEGNNWDENNWGSAVLRDEDDEAMEARRGNFLIEKKEVAWGTLAVSGGMDDSYGEVFTSLDVYKRDNETSFLKLDYGSERLKITAFWNGLDTYVTERLMGARNRIETDTYDVEVQGTIDAGPGNSLTAGGSYRRNTLDSELLFGNHAQDVTGLFLQDELRLGSGLIISVGGRYDHHPLVDGNFSPRAALIYKPADGHTLRLSYSTAYSLPTFVESYLYRKIPYIPPMYIEFVGNKEVEPEKIRSWEAGYSARLSDRVKGSVDLFYNRYEDFIIFQASAGNPLLYSFYNSGEYKAYGGELSIDLFISDHLTARGNYSYQYIWNDNGDTRISYSPVSKANAELRYGRRKGIYSTVWANYVGRTDWSSSDPMDDWTSIPTARGGTDPEVDPYILLNMNLGYIFSDNAEFNLSAINIGNDVHREFIYGDDMGRRVTATFTGRF